MNICQENERDIFKWGFLYSDSTDMIDATADLIQKNDIIDSFYALHNKHRRIKIWDCIKTYKTSALSAKVTPEVLSLPNGQFIFIGPESDHCLLLSLTN